MAKTMRWQPAFPAVALPDRSARGIAMLAAEFIRRAALSQRIAERLCSVEMSEDEQARVEKRDERNDAAITKLCEDHGFRANLSGDPRGYTVKIILPTGAYNTAGGASEGYGVPTR